MRQDLNRKQSYKMRLPAVALLTALGFIGTSTLARAQQLIDAEDQFQVVETLSNGAPLMTNWPVAETTNAHGDQLDVWRADGDATQPQPLWMSINHGPAMKVGNAMTLAGPAVVSFGPEGFMIVHTGTNNNIYFTTVKAGTKGQDVTWSVLQSLATPSNFSVSIAPLNEGSTQEIVVYKGLNDSNIHETWSTGNLVWSADSPIPGIASELPPAICFNNKGNSLFLAYSAAKTSFLTVTAQSVGATSWPQGVNTKTVGIFPSCTATASGNVVVSFADEAGIPTFIRYDQDQNFIDFSVIAAFGFPKVVSRGNGVWLLNTEFSGISTFTQIYQ